MRYLSEVHVIPSPFWLTISFQEVVVAFGNEHPKINRFGIQRLLLEFGAIIKKHIIVITIVDVPYLHHAPKHPVGVVCPV